MERPKHPQTLAASLILASILLIIPLSYATSENGFKNDTTTLIGVYGGNSAEDGYNMSVILISEVTGAYADESNFKLEMTIHTSQIGSTLAENGYTFSLLTSEKSFPEQHDIYAANIATSKTIVARGYNVTIIVTVSNKEFALETSFVEIYADTTQINFQTIVIPSKGSANIAYKWNTTSMLYGNYTINTYAVPIPGEIFTVDNIYTDGKVLVTIPGDVNGDRTVDILDVSQVSAHWYPGPPIGPLGYGANADINGDGAVDIIDVALVSAHWWQSW